MRRIPAILYARIIRNVSMRMQDIYDDVRTYARKIKYDRSYTGVYKEYPTTRTKLYLSRCDVNSLMFVIVFALHQVG